MLAIIPSVKIWIFHFGRVWWSWNEKVYREALNCANGSLFVGHVQVTVLYLPTEFKVIQTSSFDPRVIFLFGRVCRSWKEYISSQNISLLREYFTLGGCAGPERTELRERLTEGSTELATGYWEGVCYLLLTWEGLMCAWNWRLNKTHAPLLYWETFMLLRIIRSHRLDNTPAKSTVPANDKMANYKLRAF